MKKWLGVAIIALLAVLLIARSVAYEAEEQAVRATDQPGEAAYEPKETDRRDIRLLRDRFGITLPHSAP